MGGASVQIAFELPSNSSFTNENVEVINLGSREDDKSFQYRVFVTTFLGFGVNEGAKKYEKHLTEVFNKTPNENVTVPYVSDSCLPLNRFMIEEKEDGTEFVRRV